MSQTIEQLVTSKIPKVPSGASESERKRFVAGHLNIGLGVISTFAEQVVRGVKVSGEMLAIVSAFTQFMVDNYICIISDWRNKRTRYTTARMFILINCIYDKMLEVDKVSMYPGRALSSFTQNERVINHIGSYLSNLIDDLAEKKRLNQYLETITDASDFNMRDKTLVYEWN